MSWEWILVIGVGVLALLAYGFVRLDRMQRRMDSERRGEQPRPTRVSNREKDAYQIEREIEIHLMHLMDSAEIVALLEAGDVDTAIQRAQAITGATEYMAREFVEGQVRSMQRQQSNDEQPVIIVSFTRQIIDTGLIIAVYLIKYQE
ncbi:MAG: hypothetical protein AAFV33_03040 [Chloroflexota bacterium]